MARCEYSCAYLLPIAHTRLRVHRAPGIPHALCFQGGSYWQTSDALRRENADVCLHSPSLRAKRSNPLFLSCFTMDCFASLAMTVLQSFGLWLFEKLNPISAVPKAEWPLPLPLWERSDRIVRCDPGEGLRTIDRPQPLTPTLESELRSSRSHKGRGSSPPSLKR